MRYWFLCVLVLLPVLSRAESICGESDVDPLLSVQSDATVSLHLCAIIDLEDTSANADASIHVSAFSIVSPELAPEKRIVFQNKSELDRFQIDKIKKGFSVVRLIHFNESWTPFTSLRVTCSKSACQESKPKCIFKAHTKPSQQSLTRAKTALKSKKPPQDLEQITTGLIDQMYLGNRGALDLLHQLESRKWLDGELSEASTSAFKLYGVGKRAGCWK